MKLSRRNLAATGFGLLSFLASPDLLRATGNIGTSPGTAMYTDANYRRVHNKRLAEYRVSLRVLHDSVFFETYNLRPGGLVETGHFPRISGYDVRNCYVQTYWPDGKIRAQGRKQSSYPEGDWEYFDVNGKLYSRVHYTLGLVNGLAYRYYPNGDVAEMTYINGKKIGNSTRRDKQGRLLEQTNWHGEFKEGWHYEYDTLGNLLHKTLYHGDKKARDSIFYPNHHLWMTENFDSTGMIDGRNYMLSPLGKITRLDEFSHGEVVQNMCVHPVTQSDWNDGDCYPRKTEPRYPGGESKYEKLVRQHQEYPELAREWHVQGIVEFMVYLDKNGHISRYEETNLIPLGFDLEKEAMRMLKLIPNFEPLMLNGEPRESKKEMMFAFIL